MTVQDRFTAPEYEHAALVTIDLQRCTLDGQSFEIPGTSDAIRPVASLAKAFRSAGLPIVHVIRLYKPDGSNADLCRRKQLQAGAKLILVGTEGRLPAPEILPASEVNLDDQYLLSGGLQEIGGREWVMYKPRWGAFYCTPLESHLTDHGVSTVVLAGCNYPNCPRTTLYEASERDFRVIAIADGISMFDSRGREELEGIGAAVMDAAECVDQLSSVNAE